MLTTAMVLISLMSPISAESIANFPGAFSPSKIDNVAFELKVGKKLMGTIRFYSNPDGDSGTYQIENHTGDRLSYRLKINLKDGMTRKIFATVDANKTGKKASFVHAGKNKAGIKSVEIVKIKPKK